MRALRPAVPDVTRARGAARVQLHSGSVAGEVNMRTTGVVAWGRRLSTVAHSRPSYWHTPGTEPLSPLTVGWLVEQAAQRWGEREALVSVHQGHRFSFIQVQEQVDRLAAGLLGIGLKPGDRLGMWGPNSSQWYLTSLAASRAGLVLVNINPAYQAPELQYCLNKVGVRALMAAESFKTQNYHQMVQGIAPELASCPPGELRSEKLPDLTSLIVISERQLPGAFRFSDVMEASTPGLLEQVQQLQADIQPDCACNIQFTSGTTGKPKAAVLSHHNIVNNSFLVGKRFEYSTGLHRICLQVPLFHCYGFCNGLLASLHHGATLVLPGASFNPQESLTALQQESCTVVYGTPTMYVDLLNAARENKNSSISCLQMALSSGSLCSSQLFQQLQDTFKLKRVCSVYGLTETSPVVFQSLPSDTEEHMTTTVGHVAEYVEAKIVDFSGKMVPMGTPGELWVRGYFTMLGYWEDEAKTREVIGPDGWFKTGDQFVLREDGYGLVVGRLKDMINRGGEKIFPKEIEEFLESHPDILEAQVFGIPDIRLGEVVCACVRTGGSATLTPDDIKGYCKGKIAHFKIPHVIRVIDEFPKTVSGKIQKFKLKDMVEQEQRRKG